MSLTSHTFFTAALSLDWSGCTWSNGKRISSEQIQIDDSAHPNDCYQKCESYRKPDKTAPNGATVDFKTGKSCYCEFNAEAETDFDVKYRSCIFRPGKCYAGHVHEL